MGGGGVCLTDNAYESSEIGKMNASRDLIEKDTEFQLKMKEALKYWAYNCLASNTMNGFTNNIELTYVFTWWQKALLAADAVLGILTLAGGIAYIRLSVRNKKEQEE